MRPVKRTITVRGRQFVIDEEEPVHELFWDEVEAGHWEPYTFEALEEILQIGSTFIDVGAWLGAVSLFAAALGAECDAIEPDPVAYRMLCRNLMANLCAKVTPHPIALAGHDGRLQMGATDGLGSSMTSTMIGTGSFEARCCTLSHFAEGMDHVDMVKIDVEGAENLVLADREFFERFRPAILITLHPHLAPCSLDGLADLYRPVEQIAPDVHLLTPRAA